MQEIIIHYSGSASQPPISVNGDGDHCRVLISSGRSMEATEIFKGEKFSQEEFEKNVKERTRHK